MRTPNFGGTPNFGSLDGDADEETVDKACKLIQSFGRERVSAAADREAEGLVTGETFVAPFGGYPAWPMWQQETCDEKVAGTFGRSAGADWAPLPMNRNDVPWMIERVKDNTQQYYIVRWPKVTLFDNGERKSSLWFSVGRYGSDKSALQAAWRYFSDRFRGLYVLTEEVDRHGRELGPRYRTGGPTGPADPETGLSYHGDASHCFTRWTSFGKPISKKFKVVCWQKHCDTLEEPEKFCTNNQFKTRDPDGNEVYECLGHDDEAIIDHLLGGSPGPSAGVEEELLPPATELDDSKVADWWDYHPKEKKLVRVHEVPRRGLFGGVTDELEQAYSGEGGPGPEFKFSNRRVTVMHFFDGGFELLDTDNWQEQAEANPFTEPASGEGRLWTGLTLFWNDGTDPLPECLVPGTYQPRKRAEVLEALEGEIDRDNIPETRLSAIGLEQEMFIAAQKCCSEVGLIYVAVQARETGQPIQAALHRTKAIAPELWIKGPKPASLERQSKNYELTENGILCRRVYDSVEGELQFRPVVPTGAAQKIEVAGVGERSLSMRDRLILEYHNGRLGGHLGRDKTYHRLERDWWWPGMYTSVVDWCRHCLPCQKENSRTGVSAWSRTEFYDRPFRVIQFDIVQCTEHGGEGGSVTGAKYILTAICCFSRWPWLMAIPDKSAEVVAKALLEKVILGVAMFPTVFRSDNAKEFVSDLIRYMNRLLGINHITGSVYHPQSQGLVENMHRTMSHILRMLISENPTEWEAMLPYCECVLRITPLESLGGRSPYQTVTGLQPRLPRLMSCSGPVLAVGVSEYVDNLVSYLKTTYKAVQQTQKGMREIKDIQAQDEGTLGMELQVGDTVMLRMDPTVKRAGATRFQPKVRDGLWEITAKISPQTFKLCAHGDRTVPYGGTVSADNLIRVVLPTLEMDPSQPRLVEIFRNTTGEWDRFRIDKFAVDGRVFLKRLKKNPRNDRWEADPMGVWRDLSESLYRWVV